jgi:hypothetical protein
LHEFGAYFEIYLALKLGRDKMKLAETRFEIHEGNLKFIAARIAQQAAEIDKLPILNFPLKFRRDPG